MSDFFERTEAEQKASEKWRENSKDSFEKALNDITTHQERKLLTSQVILFVFVGAFVVSLLAAAFFDLLTNPALTFLKIYVNLVIIGITLLNSYFVYALFKQEVKKYTPAKPMLRLSVKLGDISPYLQASVFKSIQNYLKQGNLTDFKTFAKGFFESLVNLFPYMFGEKISKTPIAEKEDIKDPLHKDYPTVSKVFDVSQLSTTGVKISLEVLLVPRVIFSFGEGGKTAAYGFNLIYFFIIENPEHHDASKFLQQYYLISSNEVVTHSGHAIAFAFRKMGVPSDRSAYIDEPKK